MGSWFWLLFWIISIYFRLLIYVIYVRNSVFSEQLLVCKLVLCASPHLWALLQCPNIDQNKYLSSYVIFPLQDLWFLRPCSTSRFLLNVQGFAKCFFVSLFFPLNTRIGLIFNTTETLISLSLSSVRILC